LYACSSPQNPPAANVDAIVVASTTCRFQEDNCIIWKVPGRNARWLLWRGAFLSSNYTTDYKELWVGLTLGSRHSKDSTKQQH